MNMALAANLSRITAETVILLYICILAGCFILAALILPWRSFEVSAGRFSILSQQQQEQQAQKQVQSKEKEAERLAAPMMHWSKKRFPNHPSSGPFTDASFFSNATTTTGSVYSVSNKFRPSRVIPIDEVEPVDLSRFSIITTDNFSSLSFPPIQNSMYSYQSYGASTSPSSNTKDDKRFPCNSNFMKSISKKSDSIEPVVNSTEYLSLFPIAAISILCITFFMNSSKSQLTDSLTPFFVLLNPLLAAVSGAAFGYMSDVYGAVLVMIIITILNVSQFAFLLFSVYFSFSLFIVCLISPFVLSFFLTQFYCYISLTFFNCLTKSAFTGFVIMSSGLLSLVVTPMCDFSSFNSNYIPMNGLCLALSVLSGIFLFVLYGHQKGTLQKRLKEEKNKSNLRLTTESQPANPEGQKKTSVKPNMICV